MQHLDCRSVHTAPLSVIQLARSMYVFSKLILYFYFTIKKSYQRHIINDSTT